MIFFGEANGSNETFVDIAAYIAMSSIIKFSGDG